MKKVLFVATVVGHIKAFHLPFLKQLQENGWETHVAAKADSVSETEIKYCDTFHNVDFTRNPFTFSNLKTYFQLKEIMKSHNFDIIHCHTPVGGAITRLAVKNIHSNKVAKVIYTAHGFHFYNGAPLLNWLVYYPIEKFLSRYTDVLITINKEDFARAKTFHARKVEYVPGVGIDIDKIQAVTVDKTKKRKELGIPDNAFLFISVGELNRNKNHEIVIRALSMLDTNDNLYYIIAGIGPLKEHLQSLIKKSGLSSRIQLLGYRSDIIELLKISDCFVFPSLREGLPVALMEAITCGLFIVCSNIRGNTDLVEGNMTGYLLFQNTNMNSLLSCLNNAPVTKDKCGEKLSKKVIPFEQDIVIEQMKKVYSKCLSEGIRHE